jgi:isopenicillin-N N-acyltransferase-like protein
VWVSTAPWQLGEFICYDLNKVFALRGMKKDQEICDSASTIPADPFIQTQTYKNFVEYRSIKQRIDDGQQVDADSLVINNPQYYNAYVIAGDYYYKQKQFDKALKLYEGALTKVIATKEEEDAVKKKIIKCNNKLG